MENPLSFAEMKWISCVCANTNSNGEVYSVMMRNRHQVSYNITKKMEHLRSMERDVLMPVMNEYYDLFLYECSGMLPCTRRGIHKMKTDALPSKKNHYKVPFALKEAMGRQLDNIL
jgi:hypothetical protein